MPRLSSRDSNHRRAPGKGRLHGYIRERRKASVVALLISAMLLLPYSVAIYLGELKLTPIKLLIVVLMLPAMFNLIGSWSSGQRKFLASDAYAFGAFVLMSLGPATTSGSRDLVSAFSQAIEFYGVYVVARAYLYDLASIERLIRGLQVATMVVVALGVVDTLSHRYFTQDLANSLFSIGPERALNASESQLNRTVLGMESLRAASTFDHPILFGAFCVTVLPLYLYSPTRGLNRFVLVGFCITGALVALSSAPLLGLSMVAAVYLYDAIFKPQRWRWKLLVTCIAAFIFAFSVASNNPLSWLFRNLTFDPQTAYFRLLMWEIGSTIIERNFWFGVGYTPIGDRILEASIDSLMLAKAIIYGVPMVVFLYLSAICAYLPVRGETAIRRQKPLLDLRCTGFSLTLSAIMFISITVTFWNAVWLFFALCIAVRASLKEQCLVELRSGVQVRGRAHPIRSSLAGALPAR